MTDFFTSIVKELADEDVTIAGDGKGSAEFTSFVDTGCLMLNALLSGSLYGGMADNKVLVLAGESSTGKTYVALGIVREFLNKFPNGGVVYYDTESAVTMKSMQERGIDVKRVILGEPSTLQDFRTKALKFLEAYGKAKDRPPMLMVLDSLGMLSSTKEMEDTAEGKDTRDMTKAQLVRGIFRVLRLKLAKLHVPMIVTGHTYAVTGAYVPTQELSGGGGIKYASDSILFLSKSKDKDGTEVVGVILKGRMHKSRLSRENQVAAMRLSYDDGLDRYYGLLELGEEGGLIKRVGNRYEFPGGEKWFRKQIDENPERAFDPILPQLEVLAKEKFQYGSATAEIPHDPDTGELLDEVAEGAAE